MEKPSSSSQRGINLQKNTLSLNTRNSLFPSSKIQYKKTKYSKVTIDPDNPSCTSYIVFAEDIQLQSKGSSKGICYFNCSSHRRRNAPECNFRGRIKNWDISLLEGEIEIIQEHSPSCQYLVGNEVNDFSKNIHLEAKKKNFQDYEIRGGKKLDEENSLSSGELLK